MVRFVSALIALLLALAPAGGARPALASETWCDTDPPVTIVTPGGNLVVVYVVDTGPAEHLVALLTPQVTYTVRPAEGGRATDVEMHVTIQDGGLLGSSYDVGTEAWSGLLRTGAEFDSVRGIAGESMTLRFRLPIP